MTSPIDPSLPDDATLDAALRGLHREVLDEQVPIAMLDAARQVDALRQQNALRWRTSAMAASVLLAFGVGWLTHGYMAPQGSAGAVAMAGATHEFVRQASFAHAVYLPEKRHPVEVAAADQEHLVQWLSKRLGKPLKIPQLGAQGFELVGGRLLPGENGARAQFMFQNPQGQRVTLYLGAIGQPASQSPVPDTQATQFRFESDGPVPSFYWVEQDFGYALSGQVDKATLMSLSKLVYAQIN
jgi:anti-sigma factor RsiW